jgi:hypothetical protein
MSMHSTESVKHVTDALSIVTVIGTLAEILPALAALFSIVWSCFRIYETKTVQKWLGKGDSNEKTND